MTLSEYEQRRQQNIENNRKLLEELGLGTFAPVAGVTHTGTTPSAHARKKSIGSAGTKRTASATPKTPSKSRRSEDGMRTPSASFSATPTRRSSRQVTSTPTRYIDFLNSSDEDGSEGSFASGSEDEDEAMDGDTPSQRRRKAGLPMRIHKQRTPYPHPPSHGPIPGIAIGTHWAQRMDCSSDGVHRPSIAGIHGNERDGCFSVALSGGYEDDIDLGELFTYTGCGGRDLKGTKDKPKNLRTAPQSKDQVLEKANLALKISADSRKPVRVIRGFKLKSIYAPVEGYRYDGLYVVERFWEEVGLAGFKVYKCAFRRLPGQPPLEVDENAISDDAVKEESEEVKDEE